MISSETQCSFSSIIPNVVLKVSFFDYLPNFLMLTLSCTSLLLSAEYHVNTCLGNFSVLMRIPLQRLYQTLKLHLCQDVFQLLCNLIEYMVPKSCRDVVDLDVNLYTKVLTFPVFKGIIPVV